MSGRIFTYDISANFSAPQVQYITGGCMYACMHVRPTFQNIRFQMSDHAENRNPGVREGPKSIASIGFCAGPRYFRVLSPFLNKTEQSILRLEAKVTKVN